VALQTRTLRIARAMPTAHLLIDELTAYRVKVSDDGHDSYGNGRDAPNDDVVLACAIGVYVANRKRSRMTHTSVRYHNEATADPVLRQPDIVVSRPI
jgi:hypothetical protein